MKLNEQKLVDYFTDPQFEWEENQVHITQDTVKVTFNAPNISPFYCFHLKGERVKELESEGLYELFDDKFGLTADFNIKAAEKSLKDAQITKNFLEEISRNAE